MLINTAINVLWGGFVAFVLWDWFAVPLGLTPISYPQTIGVFVLLSAFFFKNGVSVNSLKNSSDEPVKDCIAMNLYSIFVRSIILTQT